MQLSRIKKVNVRTIWAHERDDFSSWLAQEDNINLLSEEIGIEISVIGQEHKVGSFKVDIFAEESQSNRKIIIENQLEKTDHDHLGKVITYASGVDAEIIIWIVKKVREEHQQAVDWLNENTREKINFFLIRMEVWKIDDSKPAPNFHIISQPNNWGKTARSSVDQAQLTDTKILQLDYWSAFKELIESDYLELSARKASPQHWYDLSIGRRGWHISLTVNSQKNEIACELYITDDTEANEELQERKEEIEDKLGKLKWMPLPGKKASRIKQSRRFDFSKKSEWPEQHNWPAERSVIFKSIFGK